MKILRNLFLLIFSFFIANTAVAQIYVTDPASCPSEYMSQTCTDPPNVCGVDGTTALCYDTATISPKSTNSSVSTGDYNTNGGFHLNCIASKDTTAPFCDQNGSFSCLQKSTCRTKNRITTCLAGTWGQAECSDCKSGYNDCSGDDACETQNGTNCEVGGLPGTWSGCVCITKILKLGPDSVGTNYLNQSSSFTKMSIDGTGVFVGSSTSSVPFNVFGGTTLSNDLSMIHNKSIKLNDASTNTVLLIGNYGDDQGFGYGTSTPRTASLAIEGDLKANRLCIKEDCRAEWTDIQGVNYWTASSTNIYSNNSGNVGIGDVEPTNKLSVIGNIAGSQNLTITGNGTILKNLGIGAVPMFTAVTFDHYSDLSGKDYVAYLSRTSNVTSLMFSGEDGRPNGADFGYDHSQMTLGTLTDTPINFITQGTSKMFLSSDGKLGIGTTDPLEALDVNGGTRIGLINNATGDIVTVSVSGVIQKRTAEEIRGDIGAAKEINSLYYVEGNTGGTAGTWTGSIDGLTAYYDGLTIAYKIGTTGGSGLTLNINNLGAVAVYRNTGVMTTHLPVGTVVVLTYTMVSGMNRWIWADYDSDTLYYLRWVGPNVIAGTTTQRYKIIMEGHDGRFYPFTLENTTSGTKTVSSAKFKMNGQILWYSSTTIINENSAFASTNLYSDYYSATTAGYTFNQSSGWTDGRAVYLVGAIDNQGYFVLAGAGSTGGTDFLSQDLPTTDDGKVYILLGYMTNTTSGFKLTPDRVAYHYKDGKLRLYETMSGTGDTNYLSKWTSGTSFGQSLIYDTGTDVGIGTTNPSSTLHVDGHVIADSPLFANHLATKSYVDSAVATTSSSLWTLNGSNLYASSTAWNVGIGNDDPTNKLAVSGNIAGSGSLSITGTATSSNYFISNLGIGSFPNGVWNKFVDLSGIGNSAYISKTDSINAVMAASNTGTPTDTGYNFTYASHQMVLGTITNHPINFITNGTSKMFLSNDGKLGIGTVSPSSPLHVSGSASGDQPSITIQDLNSAHAANTPLGQIYFSNNLNNVSAKIAGVRSSVWDPGSGHFDGDLAFYTKNMYGVGDYTTEKMRILYNGNVGIGTTSPASALHIYPQNNIEGLRIVSSNYSPLVIRNTADNTDIFRVNQLGDVTAVTSSATRMRSNNYCDASGNNCFDPTNGWSSAGYFATVTAATYTGNNNNNLGYAYAHARCNDQLTGSHVCSAEEILNTIREGRDMPSVNVWIFNGPPGFEAVANDCAARGTNLAAADGKNQYGSYWQAPSLPATPLGKGLLMQCNVSLSLACCR